MEQNVDFHVSIMYFLYESRFRFAWCGSIKNQLHYQNRDTFLKLLWVLYDPILYFIVNKLKNRMEHSTVFANKNKHLLYWDFKICRHPVNSRKCHTVAMTEMGNSIWIMDMLFPCNLRCKLMPIFMNLFHMPLTSQNVICVQPRLDGSIIVRYDTQ